MKIDHIESQYRRDFVAIYVCEHCGFFKRDRGYDDEHFHRNVIPRMVCESCGHVALLDYRPLTTTYPEGFTV